jgi:hypothetical protein
LIFLLFLSHSAQFFRDEEEEEMEQLQVLLLSSPSLQPPSDEIVQKCTLVSEHRDLDSLGRGRESVVGVDAGEENGGGGLSTSERENLRAFRAGFLSSLRQVREIIVASNSIEKEEIGAVRFTDDEDEDEREKEVVVSTSGVKKKVLIEVIGDDEEKSPSDEKKKKKKQSQMWNDFALLLCGMMETSDGIPSWSSKECSDLAREMLEECFMHGSSSNGSNSEEEDDDDDGIRRAPLTSDALDGERIWRDLKSHKSAPEKESWNTKLADRRDARAFYASVQALSVLEHVPFGEHTFERFTSIALRALEFETLATKRVGARITERLLSKCLEVKDDKGKIVRDTRGISKVMFEQLKRNMVGATSALFAPTLQAFMACASVRKHESLLSSSKNSDEDAEWRYHDAVLLQSLDSVALHVDDHSFVVPLLRTIPELCAEMRLRIVGRYKSLIPSVLAWSKAPSNEIALLALEALHDILQWTWPRAYSRCDEIWESMKIAYEEGPRIIEEEKVEKRRRAVEKVLTVLNAACGPVFTRISCEEKKTEDAKLRAFVEGLKKYEGDGHGNPYVGFKELSIRPK